MTQRRYEREFDKARTWARSQRVRFWRRLAAWAERRAERVREAGLASFATLRGPVESTREELTPELAAQIRAENRAKREAFGDRGEVLSRGIPEGARLEDID